MFFVFKPKISDLLIYDGEKIVKTEKTGIDGNGCGYVYRITLENGEVLDDIYEDEIVDVEEFNNSTHNFTEGEK